MAAGGERGVMCRTMHKNDIKKNSPVPIYELLRRMKEVGKGER